MSGRTAANNETANNQTYDLVVVGGGINGAGIARDAAGRGLKVLLCEKDDLASATSSASTKLIHGGLRYLEYYEFRLVREALIEREVLLRAAPHIIWPMTFVLPHSKEQRPAWMLRLGLFLYDHLGGRERLPGSRAIDLRRDPVGGPLVDDYVRAFSYADCWVEDARLVVLNAMDARERGAEIHTRTRCRSARREGGLWQVELCPEDGRPPFQIQARAMVNAAGPWVTEVMGAVAGANREKGLRLVKGSHFVVPRLHEGEQAYILQNDDRRIMFIIPYERHYSLIGTTELPYEGDPAKARITEPEIDYLLRAVNRYLAKPVRAADIVWSYAGVRPLFDDASSNSSAVTRDYVFDMDGGRDEAPLLSIFGGKITTYRKLAEQALDKLQPWLGFAAGTWTEQAALPGGDMPGADFNRYLADFTAKHAWLPAPLARRYLRAYGTRTIQLLDGAGDMAGLGCHLGDDLYEAEVTYLQRYEWAVAAEDILWRRSKLGLHITAETTARLRDWMAGHKIREPQDAAAQ